MKYIVFLGDGMADEPLAELGGRTLLEASNTPNLDRIAREGRTGLFRTLTEDVPAGSDSANLSVMGYNPRECLQGRGVLEAASMGVDIAPGQMAMRMNLICIKDGLIKNHSAGHISTEESDEILTTLREELGTDKISFHTGVSYRHLFVGEGLDPRLKCSPPHDYPGQPAANHAIHAACPEAEETAALLNELTRRSQEILKEHPVNVKRRAAGKDEASSIWLWSPGVRPEMWTYQERFGISGSVISAVDLIKGIGAYAGLELIEVEGATGLSDTNYEGKADACLAALAEKDFVYLHVEAPDEAGHEGDAALKRKTIEDFDARCVGRVLAGLEREGIEATCAVLPDHPTPVAKRVHTRDPIPFAIWTPGVTPDGVTSYSEKACAEGSLGTIEGDTFIKMVFGQNDF